MFVCPWIQIVKTPEWSQKDRHYWIFDNSISHFPGFVFYLPPWWYLFRRILPERILYFFIIKESEIFIESSTTSYNFKYIWYIYTLLIDPLTTEGSSDMLLWLVLCSSEKSDLEKFLPPLDWSRSFWKQENPIIRHTRQITRARPCFLLQRKFNWNLKTYRCTFTYQIQITNVSFHRPTFAHLDISCFHKA